MSRFHSTEALAQSKHFLAAQKFFLALSFGHLALLFDTVDLGKSSRP